MGPFYTPLSTENTLLLGFGMGGRGEFSFLIADNAVEEEVIDATDHSATIWALLLSSLITPYVFRWLLLRQRKKSVSLFML
jgi:Kef-type K+ transport system membrane component KefB